MKVYIVRIIESHEPVGVFQANSLYELSILVDAAIRPNDCEYAVLPKGTGMSLEGDRAIIDGKTRCNPWMQPIRKWTQLEGCNDVPLRWQPLQSQIDYKEPEKLYLPQVGIIT